MKRVAIAALAIVWLLTAAGSCATTSGAAAPQVIYRTIDRPIAARCAVTLPPEPAWPDTDAALRGAPDLFARVKLLVAGRLERIAYQGQLEAALAGCTGASP